MIGITIDNRRYFLQSGISILDACRVAGSQISRFCYNETLSIAGNCRMCLVEVEGVEKPVASCLTEVSNDMVVFTNSLFAKKARENVMEALLLNHPLDCPICDQAGECDLQDQAKVHGSDFSKFSFGKRGVEDKICSPLIQTIMTRCIHCTRCVRFSEEITGATFLGTFNRGSSTEIGGYSKNFFDSEISGNVIDLCPVGALTSKPFGFKARPWELRATETIDTTDSMGAPVYVHFKNTEIFRVLPKSNSQINGSLINDKTRFSYDAGNNNRLTKGLTLNNSKTDYVNFKWSNFFKTFDSFLTSKKITINLNEDIGLNDINLLICLSRMNKNINLYNLNANTETNNIYSWGMSDKISSIDSSKSAGIVLSLNPKVECSVINARIRSRSQKSLLSLLTLDTFFASTVPTNNINLNLQKSLRVLEGKCINFFSFLLRADSPLVLLGESLVKRGLSLFSMINYLRNIFNSINILKINQKANSEALALLNVQNMNKQMYDNSDILMCLNLENTFNTRKNIYNTEKLVFWFNTHWKELQTKLNYVLPIFSVNEEEKVLINLEQRPQKTRRSFSKPGDARSLSKIFLALFNKESSLLQKKNVHVHLNHIFSLTRNPFLFDELNRIYSLLCYNSKNYNTGMDYLYKYPTKYYMENLFAVGKFAKNSIVMKENLINTISVDKNFI